MESAIMPLDLSGIAATTTTTPPPTPLSATRTTTPRDLPTMYHFDLYSSTENNATIARNNEQPNEAGCSGSQSGDLSPCPICSRTFNPVAFRKHIGICEKTTTRKRKVFDSSRQRREGTDLATYVLPKNFGLPNASTLAGVHPPTPAAATASPAAQVPAQANQQQQQLLSPTTTRRRTSQDQDLSRSVTRASVRKVANQLSANIASTAAGAAAGDAKSSGSSTSLSCTTQAQQQQQQQQQQQHFSRNRQRASERVKLTQQVQSERCPHCERTFGLKAYDRHVDWCKEKAIQATIKSSTTNEQNKAKERLDARNKYRPPNLKTKRSINRDKYSGTACGEQDYERSESPCSSMVSSKNGLLSASMTSSLMSDRSSMKIPKPERSILTPRPIISQRTVIFERSEHGDDPQQPQQQQLQHDVHRRSTTKRNGGCIKRDSSNSTNGSNADHAAGCVTGDMNRYVVRKDNASNTGNVIKTINNAVAKSRMRREKVNAIKNDIKLPPLEHMKYKGMNGLTNSKDTIVAACQISIEQRRTSVIKKRARNEVPPIEYEVLEPKGSTKSKLSTSLVRTARRQMRTKEHPSIDIRTIQQDAEEDIEVRKRSIASEPGSLEHVASVESLVTSSSDRSLPIFYNKSQLKRYMRDVENEWKAEAKAKAKAKQQQEEQERQEIQTKLAFNQNTLMPIRRPRKNKKSTALSTMQPMRVMPIERESFNGISQTMPMLPMIEFRAAAENDVEDNVCDEVVRLRNIHLSMAAEPDLSDECVMPEEAGDLTIIKAPYDTYSHCELSCSGLNDKYDPFLSAKRQLEELCSPTTPNEPLLKLGTPTTTPTTPNVNIPTKMSTSLILNSAATTTHQCSPQPIAGKTPNTILHNNNNNNNSSSVMTKSNFRRTSSLRGPRRSPMLASRPLFSHNYRPTIQRGLSDEGPISTNFLKPEEYDEMPVRAVCVNDFAVTHSPRVVRRDTSASNRKEKLKLQIPRNQAAGDDSSSNNNNNNTSSAQGQATTTAAEEKDGDSTTKYVSKTDSLAVFLKYEHELEKLNAKQADSTATASNQFSSKELKDKSNTLNKQNSAKNLKLETLSSEAQKPTTPSVAVKETATTTTPVSQLPVLLSKTVYEQLINNSKENNENVCSTNYAPLRLEPIASKPATPLSNTSLNVSKPSTPLTKPTTPGSKPNTPLTYTNLNMPRTTITTTTLPALVPPLQQHQQQQQQQQTVNLHAIFGGESKPTPHTSSTHFSYKDKERKLSTSSDYIDPKLINKFDNLPVNLKHVLKSSDSEAATTHEQRSDTSSSESSAPVSQLTKKLLPLGKQQQQTQQQQQQQSQQLQQQQQQEQISLSQSSSQSTVTHASVEKRNSAEGRNLLKRKMRLGRNQFLYDASPEADSSCCSADDEANRSSMEYDEQRFNHGNYRAPTQTQPQHQNQQQQHNLPTFLTTQTATAQPQHLASTATTTTQFIPPPMPILEDFDFEEFLSSFENDDEKFPLFKDCREFLMNRTSNKQRSLLTSNSSNTKNTNHNNNQTNLDTTTPTLVNQNNNNNNKNNTTSFPTQKHFQFPNNLLTSNSSNLIRSSSSNTSQNLSGGRKHMTNAGDANKREIFISIETEQNDLGHSPLSPESLRHIVGNAQTHVEVVEIDGSENKFSKISDDDDDDVVDGNDGLRVKDHDDGDDDDDVVHRMMHTALPPPPPPSMFQNEFEKLPNVQINNAKNLMQKMQSDFRQDVVGSGGGGGGVNISSNNTSNNNKYDDGLTAKQQRPATTGSVQVPPYGLPTLAQQPMQQQQQQQQTTKIRSPNTPSGDSDELSSLDSYPISSSQSSRRGVSSKLSSDSAYGSLSRQRSTELIGPIRQRTRPSTATAATNTKLSSPMIDAATQAQYNTYTPLANRTRHFSSGSTSSSSEHSLSAIKNSNNNQQYQQQQTQKNYANPHSNNNSSSNNSMLYGNNNNNNSKNLVNDEILNGTSNAMELANTTTSTHSLSSSSNKTANSNSNSISNSNTNLHKSSSMHSAMSASMKMSKFCHECGAKFIIEHAKFCMDCGVKRVIL